MVITIYFDTNMIATVYMIKICIINSIFCSKDKEPEFKTTVNDNPFLSFKTVSNGNL